MSAHPQPRLPKLGEVIGGKYELVRILGQGGMGVVFEGKHTRLGQRVAIKMLLPEVLALPSVIERFEREARAVASLRSRHVARVLDVDATSDGVPFMVMEFLEGRDLSDELAHRGPLPIDEAVGWIVQACEGMAEAHAAGIVHRDLKPANLFLANEGTTRVLKLLDFGISKMNDGNVALTSTHVSMGTPLYMSPEQVRSSKSVDERTDVWSLSVILYELLTGRPPFLGESATAVIAAIVSDEPTPLLELRPEVPLDTEAAVRIGMSKDVKGRLRSVRELSAALQGLATTLPRGPSGAPARPLPGFQPSARSEPAGAAVTGASWSRAHFRVGGQKKIHRGVWIGAGFVGIGGGIGIVILMLSGLGATKKTETTEAVIASAPGSAIPAPIDPSVPSATASSADSALPPPADSSTSPSPRKKGGETPASKQNPRNPPPAALTPAAPTHAAPSERVPPPPTKRGAGPMEKEL